jgi:hypothetical protein
MVSSFDLLEADFFAELVRGTHGLWEVFEFTRLHHPQLDDRRIFERGSDYIKRWVDAGWIQISTTPVYPSTISTLSDAQAFLRQNGAAATRYLGNSPSIDITEEAQRVYQRRTG